MGLIDSMFSPQLDAIQQSLSLATKRTTLLNSNLANANTPGYKRKDIDFNITLEQAMGTSKGSHLADFNQENQQALSDQTSISSDGNNVDPEREVQGIAETQLRYTALSQMASGYFSDLKSVITGAK